MRFFWIRRTLENCHGAQHGFTLIEFMIATALSVIALSIASPVFYPLLQSYRISSTANSLERSLRHARQEAVFKNRTVRLCPSSDGNHCDDEVNWSVGFISYLDFNNDSVRQTDEDILKRYPPSPRVRITFNRRQQISFNGLGRAGTNGSFTVCDPVNKVKSHRITLIHSGRLRNFAADSGCS